MKLQRYYGAVATAWAGGAVGATLAAAWLVGDQSTAAEAEGSGHVPAAAPVSESVLMSAGIAGLAILVVTAIAIRRYPLTYSVFVLATAAGALLGGSYRVMVADVIGANIGAGLVMLIAWPLAGILAVSALLVGYLARPKRPLSSS